MSWNVAGVSWKGQFTGNTNYAANDVVSYGGASWIALRPSLNTVPGQARNFWATLAAPGPQGPAGNSGPRGPAGQAGSNGMPFVQTESNSDGVNILGGKTSPGWATIATMHVEVYPSSYAIFAKLDVSYRWWDSDSHSVECRLVAGSDADMTQVIVDDAYDAQDYRPIALNIVHAFTAPPGNEVRLQCFPNTGGDKAFDITITAMRATTLINKTLS